MSKPKTKDELQNHRNQAITSFDSYIESLINSSNEKDNSKADKLCYWINDWKNFLSYEPQFNPIKLKRYKRGEIIKVHLGFNVGSEEGGLHYAVVIENDNPKSSPVLTIVPLTSVKCKHDELNLLPGTIYLGNDLYSSLTLKITTISQNVTKQVEKLEKLISENAIDSKLLKKFQADINDLKKELIFLDRMSKESQKMKKGSIALVNQITTISKIRIYDPKINHDILSGIKLSPENMDKIDSEIIKRYTHK